MKLIEVVLVNCLRFRQPEDVIGNAIITPTVSLKKVSLHPEK
jgi:hypothetical protein